MSKIHITLVGGQTAPVYNGIVYTNPDKIIYIYSDRTREETERLSTEIKIESEKRKFDPVNLEKIERDVQKCAEDFRNEKISINISSGTKPWAFYFSKIFSLMPNATLFYVDQNNKVWNFSNKTFETINIDVDVHLNLYGNSLDKYIRFHDISTEDKDVVLKIIELHDYNKETFFRLIARMRDRSNEIEHHLPNGSYLKWDVSNKQFYFNIIKKGISLKKTLKSKNVRHLLLKAGWFEYRIASIISSWEHAIEIRMNCTFPYKDSATKNEIDIIVNTGKKLLFVECKTQIEDNTDIDKFNSAVRNYGGTGCKSLFVTNTPMTDRAREKCEDYKILTYSLQDNHFNMTNEEALHLLLNNELFNINA